LCEQTNALLHDQSFDDNTHGLAFRLPGTSAKRFEHGIEEILFYASMIHLVFLKIHPWNDGNGK
jgi:hypothetical protein